MDIEHEPARDHPSGIPWESGWRHGPLRQAKVTPGSLHNRPQESSPLASSHCDISCSPRAIRTTSNSRQASAAMEHHPYQQRRSHSKQIPCGLGLRVNRPLSTELTVAFQWFPPSSKRWIAQSIDSFRSTGFGLESKVNKIRSRIRFLEPRPSSRHHRHENARLRSLSPGTDHPRHLGSPLAGISHKWWFAATQDTTPSAHPRHRAAAAVDLRRGWCSSGPDAEDPVSTLVVAACLADVEIRFESRG